MSIYFATVVALGGFVFGFDASVISGVVGFVTNEFALNEWQQGFVVSAPTLGAVIGSTFAGPCADRFGRKKVIIFVAALYLISALFSAFAVSYEMLVTARVIGGFAFASLILAPMYIAEISPSHLRGKMISINQLNIVIGLSAAYFTNYYLLQLSGGSSELATSLGITENVWRWMLGLEILPAAIFFLLLFTIPESPRWLVVNNKVDQAKVVIAKLFPEQSADKAIAELKNDNSEDLPPLLSRLKMLFSNHIGFILLVGVVVAVIQQITGINAIFFYAPSIFEQSGVGQDASFSQAVLVGVINVVFTVVSMMLVDKLGRKPLLLAGLAGICISLMTAAYGFKQATYQLTQESVMQIESVEVREKVASIVEQQFDNELAFKQATIELLGEQEARQYQAELIQASASMNSMLILLAILGFVASFAVSLGPIMWILLAEIFPNHLRGVGIALTGLINSAVSFTVQLVFPWELANLGTALTFMIYGIFAFIGFILIYRMLPETKGKSLEEIEGVFAAKAGKA